MGLLLIVCSGTAWILYVHPTWFTNHWKHWLFS